MPYTLLILLLTISFNNGFDVEEKIHGITLVAPPRPFESDPMIHIQRTNAEWIAVVPYAFNRQNETEVHHDPNGKHWWGERPEGVKKTIEYAYTNNIKVMLKPQVYVPGSWTGYIYFDDDTSWNNWEASYREYIMLYAEIAACENVDMFCIGTEFGSSTKKRPEFWSDLIDDIRSIYSGSLTYASNWDEYENVSFWRKLDFIGIDAYFPLSNEPNPSIKDLKKAWKPLERQLSRFSSNQGRPIIFTEYGYMSVEYCTKSPWDSSANRAFALNESAQSNALIALHETFDSKDYWAGSFLWKWYHKIDGRRAEYIQKDYSPQGKLAEKTLTSIFE